MRKELVDRQAGYEFVYPLALELVRHGALHEVIATQQERLMRKRKKLRRDRRKLEDDEQILTDMQGNAHVSKLDRANAEEHGLPVVRELVDEDEYIEENGDLAFGWGQKDMEERRSRGRPVKYGLKHDEYVGMDGR